MSGSAIYIVMGVSGCGKSTMAPLLAEACGGAWLDADDFHSDANKAKMAHGIPLTDEDRVPWLEQLNAILRQASRDQKTIVLACSALKQSYRDRLTAGLPRYCIVYLKGTFDFIHARLARRKNHFMPADLLQSQFADLEEPKDAIVLEISQTQAAMIAAFEEAIGR